MDCRHFSLEHLLDLSYRYGLISDYRISPSRVRLFQDSREIIACDPEEARIFLQGLITGRSSATRRQLDDQGILPPASGAPPNLA